MATPPEEELKARAAFNLKRVMEISSTATKTAIVSFSALAVIWFGQIRPQSQQLTKYVNATLQSFDYEAVDAAVDVLKRNQKELVDISQAKTLTLTKPDVSSGASPSSSIDDTPMGKKEKGQVKKLDIKRAEFENLAKSVSFELLGLKVPVPPMYAALVWNILLIIMLVYLARARFGVWSRCAEALSSLKKLGQKEGALEEIAGSGPLWIAPPPSRPGEADAATIQDLRSAFGWNRLETLPSIAATAGFLLLSLLQLAVTSEGYNVLRASQRFTKTLTSSIPASAVPREWDPLYPSKLDKQIHSLTDSLALSAEKSETFDRFTMEQRLSDLTVGSVQGPLISLFLFMMLGATALLVFWWFRPWRVPNRSSGTNITPQKMAGALLALVLIVSLFLILGRFKPNWGWLLGDILATILPYITVFLAASVVTSCVIELLFLASSSSTKAIRSANGQTD